MLSVEHILFYSQYIPIQQENHKKMSRVETAFFILFFIFIATKIQSFFLFSAKMSNYLTLPIAIGYKSCRGNFSRRYWAYRRHRYRRFGVREGLLRILAVFTKKGADEAKRNRRWCRWLPPTKEKPLSHVGWAQDKGFIWKGGFGWSPR